MCIHVIFNPSAELIIPIGIKQIPNWNWINPLLDLQLEQTHKLTSPVRSPVRFAGTSRWTSATTCSPADGHIRRPGSRCSRVCPQDVDWTGPPADLCPSACPRSSGCVSSIVRSWTVSRRSSPGCTASRISTKVRKIWRNKWGDGEIGNRVRKVICDGIELHSPRDLTSPRSL